MKKGTLNKLFGKKNVNNNSLYADNPPWILPQGSWKAPADYHDVHNSFAFLDDSGTATLKSRPGPRVRPTLNFSTSNTESQVLAVPTPSVPKGFTDNASLGNGSKLNGNYRMYSSVGDLHLTNYYDEEIPAPPNMPPPPPPTMAPPPPPPQKSPPSAISSPTSPSPPDFIPPSPNSSAPMPPIFLPTDQSAGSTTGPYSTNNVAKWKSETGLNAVSKDVPMTLPNRFTLNPAALQHNQGQTNTDGDPRSTLPKSFKIPPPAPTRISSIQFQEPQNHSYTKDPPPSPVPSSFNPSFQARLFTSNQGQQSLNDTLNKRKSMLIMEDLPDVLENSDQRIEKSMNMMDTVGARASSSPKDNTNILHTPHVKLNKEIKNDNAINEDKAESASIFKENQPKRPYQLNNRISELTSVLAKGEEEHKYSHNGTELNTLTVTKHGYTQEIQKTSKPTVKIISLKPVSDLSNSNGSQNNSLTRKEMDMFPRELARLENEVKTQPAGSSENSMEQPPTPPLMAPPPPPMAPPPPPPPMPIPPNQKSMTPLPLPVQNSTPPKNSPIINSTAPPPAPPLDPAPVVRMPSPLLSPKPKNISVTPKPPSLVPPPPPPPPPPPLPSSLGLSGSIPLQEALQAKQHTLKKIPKTIEIRSAQTSSNPSVDDEQKIRVGKIKGELEALFSPKKDEKGQPPKNSRLGLEPKKNSSGNFSQPKGGENNLVNSLMLKVPLLPAKFERDEGDADNSEWLPKSNKMDIQIPEPDYLPASPIHKMQKSAYSDVQSKIPKATLERSVPSPPVVSTEKDTPMDVLNSSIPTYKPHRDIKLSTENSTLNELPVVIAKPDTDISLNLESVHQSTKIDNSGPPVKQEPPTSQAESSYKQPVSERPVEGGSPMALLMAAQKRAQKVNSVEKRNLPKISVTNGLITSSSPSPASERKATTFLVVPNKENVGQLAEEEVTSFTFNSVHKSGSSIPSVWREEALLSSDIRPSENSSDNFSVPYGHKSSDVLLSTTDRHEEYLKPKLTFDNHASYTVPISTESPSFNISSFPSPIPLRKMDNEMEYGIIPPPAEFMNSPVGSSSNLLSMEKKDIYPSDHRTSLQSDFLPNYDRNNSIIQPFASLSSTSSGFNSYSSDNYSSGLNRDPQRSSLIKKRLYMPEPESSRNYGLNTSSIRSAMPMSYMHSQFSSSMVPDPRRSNTTSRYLPQGRRLSTENISRLGPPMTDMKYRSPNSDNLMGKSSTRSQGKNLQGMTFTVRPGTRQPISQMYQGGYL